MGSRHRDISRTVVLLASLLAQKKTCLLFSFCPIGTTAREKYHVKEIYLFGSYARCEADAQSDLDFLIFGGDGFLLTEILFSLMRHRII